MGEARAETTIQKPADEVWALVGSFGELDWMPGVDSCRLEGDDRIISMFGMEITERQLRRDDAERTLTYGIVGGPVTVEKHEATITVTPAGEGSHVTWDVVTDDGMVEMMQGTYQGALDTLKANLEG
jgi:carbon monoxide dehydrogenase subunit G